MPLIGIIWIIMQHLNNVTSWNIFTLDVLLTVIRLIYKNLFSRQAFNGLSVIFSTIKFFAKKENRFG